MSLLCIQLEISDIRISTYSSYKKYDDEPVKHGRVIIINGKPIYSTTYPSLGNINFTDGEKAISLPDIATFRLSVDPESDKNIGELNYVASYSDNELCINEPNQFEVVMRYPESEFEVVWNLLGVHNFGEVYTSCCIEAPKSDVSGYVAIFDISESTSWKVGSFTIRRQYK